MGIVVFGAVFVDVKGYPEAQYIPGGRNVGKVIQVHGGVSRNIVEDIANIGLRPTFVSVVDDSGLSIDVIEKLKRHHVETKYITQSPDGLGTWLAVFDNNGDVVASISKRPDLSGINITLDLHGDEIFRKAHSAVVEIDMEKDSLDRIYMLAEKYSIPVFAAVSNMSIAMERREYLNRTACIVCNDQEAGMLFSEEFENVPRSTLPGLLLRKIRQAGISKMVVTLGEKGAIYADAEGDHGYVPPQKVDVIDTTGAGDAFFSGTAVGLTYGKTLRESCEIGTRLASAVIATKDSCCPRFKPAEFGL